MRKGVIIGCYILIVYSLLINGCMTRSKIKLHDKSATGKSKLGWIKTFGGTGNDCGYSVQQTYDGGYIITGSTESFGVGYEDVYLIKTNANGDTIWTKTFGGTLWDSGHSVQQTTDSGYIIAGVKNECDRGGDVYIIKTTANGDTSWTKTFDRTGIDYAYSIQKTLDRGYIISGYSESSLDTRKYYVYLIKTDANGIQVWTKTYGRIKFDRSYSVQQTPDEGYIIIGSTYSFGDGESDVYLIKTDVNGDTIWTKIFGGTNYDFGLSVQPTSDSGYIIAGSTYSFGAGGTDVYLIKTSTNGDTVWTKTFGGTKNDEAFSVQQTSDNGYIIAGKTCSYGIGGSDVYLIKTDLNGNQVWTKTFGGTHNDRGYSVQQTSDGGYIITGGSESFDAGGGDVYLIKTDANGNTE